MGGCDAVVGRVQLQDAAAVVRDSIKPAGAAAVSAAPAAWSG